jgi:quinohemoprotein ethanol dehydrogenase
LQGTPLVVDGVMYASAEWSVVYALDARTGEVLWKYDPLVPRETAYKYCCGAVNRGVAVWQDKVYVGTLDGRLIAIDAVSGLAAWETQTTDINKAYSITGAPRIANGKVIIGNGGSEYGVRGYVSAYDAATGEQAWRFYTIPGNPADGFENELMAMAAKTWTGEWWKVGGGGTVWDSIVYDPELNILYIGVGNGAPHNRDMRSPDGGDNLFLTSIVAVNADSGEYLWHHQQVEGDTWDYTATQQMVLAEIEWQGLPRKVSCCRRSPM